MSSDRRNRAVIARIEAEESSESGPVTERKSRAEQLLDRVMRDREERAADLGQAVALREQPGVVEDDGPVLSGGLDPNGEGTPIDADRNFGDRFARRYSKPTRSGIGNGMLTGF